MLVVGTRRCADRPSRGGRVLARVTMMRIGLDARHLDAGPRGARKQYMDSVMRLARRDVPVPVRAGFCDSTSILGFTA